MPTGEFQKALKYLEDYDKLGTYPDRKKRVTISISNKSVAKLKNIKNKSRYIDNLILSK